MERDHGIIIYYLIILIGTLAWIDFIAIAILHR